MGRHLPLLESVQIDKPCHENWDKMRGDHVRRYCDSCRLHVHDLTAMTGAEAESLLRRSDGRACIRMARDKLGRPMTLDRYTFGLHLPFGLTRYLARAVAALAFLLHASGCARTTGMVCYGPPGRGRIPKELEERSDAQDSVGTPTTQPAQSLDGK